MHITEAPLSLGAGRHNVLAGLRYVAQRPTIRSLVTMTAMISLLGRSYGQLMPVFARDFLRLDAAGMSLLYTAAGFGSFVGAMTLLLLKNPDNKGRLAFASGGGCAVALALFSLSRLLWLSVGLLFVMGFVLMTFSTMVSTLLQTYAPAEVRGRVMSVYTISWQGLEYVGVLLTGGLASLVSTTPVVLGAAVIVGVLIATVEVAHRGAPQLQ